MFEWKENDAILPAIHEVCSLQFLMLKDLVNVKNRICVMSFRRPKHKCKEQLERHNVGFLLVLNSYDVRGMFPACIAAVLKRAFCGVQCFMIRHHTRAFIAAEHSGSGRGEGITAEPVCSTLVVEAADSVKCSQTARTIPA